MKLWESLKPEHLVALINYQWDAYGETLLDSLIPSDLPVNKVELEDISEIDRIMRQPPKTYHGEGE